MASNETVDEGMDSLYPGESSPEGGDGKTSDGKAESVDQQNEDQAEILASKSELPASVKEGDTCTFRVVKDYGDEFGLQYIGESQDGKGKKPMTDDEELEAMDKETS